MATPHCTATFAIARQHIKQQFNSYEWVKHLVEAADEKNLCLYGWSVRRWIVWNIESAAQLVQATHLGFLAADYAVLTEHEIKSAATDVERILSRARSDPIEFLTHFDCRGGDDHVNSAYQRTLRSGIVHLSPVRCDDNDDYEGDTVRYLIAFLQGLQFILQEALKHQLAVVHVAA